jgi:steroid delta-isomerase-like uncharacterized protein
MKTLTNLSVLTVVLLGFTLSAGAQMTHEEAWELGHSYVDMRNSNLENFNDFYAEDVVGHYCDVPEPMNRDQIRDYYAQTNKAFPDGNFQLTDLWIDGETYLWRFSMEGTNTGPFGEMEPTDKPVKFVGIGITHFNDEHKIKEIWTYWNQASLLGQLGLMGEK